MNSLTVKRSGKPAVLAVRIAVFCCLAFSTSTWADSGCGKVRGEAELTSAPAGPFQGPAWISLGEAIFYPQLLVVGTGAKVTEDGTVVGTTSITFDFGGGDVFVLGNDHFALDPTDIPGEFRLTDHGRITEGMGSFAEAFGKLMLQGTISFSATGVGTANLTIKGKICDVAS